MFVRFSYRFVYSCLARICTLAWVEKREDRKAANAERMRRSRAEQKKERKAVDAERKRKARAEKREDRKAGDAEPKRKGRAEDQGRLTFSRLLAEAKRTAWRTRDA